jgi:hypothetical protein
MTDSSERRFLRFAMTRLGHLFPYLPKQPGCNKRMRALAPQIVRLFNAIASTSSSWCDNVRLMDSTPVPVGASRETVKRSDFAGYAAYRYCARPFALLLGLPAVPAPDGMLIAFELAPANAPSARSPRRPHHARPDHPNRATPARSRHRPLAQLEHRQPRPPPHRLRPLTRHHNGIGHQARGGTVPPPPRRLHLIADAGQPIAPAAARESHGWCDMLQRPCADACSRRRGRRRGGAWIAFGFIAASLAVGCGGERVETAARHGDPSRDAYYSRHPYALTCDHVLAIDSVKAHQFHIAAFALADDVRLPRTNRNLVWGRFIYAMLDLCKASDRRDYRPAYDAVRLVSKGRYVISGPPTAAEVRRLNADRRP